jgi:hypothetical protein
MTMKPATNTRPATLTGWSRNRAATCLVQCDGLDTLVVAALKTAGASDPVLAPIMSS